MFWLQQGMQLIQLVVHTAYLPLPAILWQLGPHLKPLAKLLKENENDWLQLIPWPRGNVSNAQHASIQQAADR